MPELTLPSEPASPRYGRPPRTVTERERLEMTAVLIDLAWQTRRESTRILFKVDDPTESAELKMLRRDLPVARRMLSSRFVLPWALWQDGQVPGGWWESEEFEEGVHMWREDAVRSPVASPAPTIMPDYVQHMREQMLAEPHDVATYLEQVAQRERQREARGIRWRLS